MACAYAIEAYAPPSVDLRVVLEEAFDEVDRIDRLMSHYKSESPLSRLNREAARHAVTVDKELFDFIERSLRYSDESDGAFDITVGPLMKTWGFFRGEPRVKKDADVTDADIAASNLVLFGDPSSNAVYKRIAARLPIQWRADGVRVGREKFSADHAPVFVFPNPLNPSRYVVINSGFTFHDQANNAMQTPKLPDWAVVDITKPGNNYRYLPLFVTAQGFFDESWKLHGAASPTGSK